MQMPRKVLPSQIKKQHNENKKGGKEKDKQIICYCSTSWHKKSMYRHWMREKLLVDGNECHT